MEDPFRRRLVELVGARGAASPDTAVPASVDDAVAVCRLCAETGTPIAVTSGAATGRTVPGGALLIALEALDEVAVEPARLVVTAGAGAIVESVRTAAARHGLVPVGMTGLAGERRVGSVVAAGGIPRRAVTGVEAVLATGERLVFGGAVLKDVTGYDVPGVLLGSRGRLGLVLRVTLRLQPAGRPVETAAAAGAPGPSAAGAALRRAFDPRGLLRPLD